MEQSTIETPTVEVSGSEVISQVDDGKVYTSPLQIEEYLAHMIGEGHMETLVSLYRTSEYHRNLFNRADFLQLLAQKFNLEEKKTFDKLLTEYDRKYLTIRCDRDYSSNKCLRWAAKKGDIYILNVMLNAGADDYDGAFIMAAQSGNREIMNLMIEKGADAYGEAAAAAAYGGHMDIVQEMYKLDVNKFGASNIQGVAVMAAKGGYIDIYDWAIKNGAENNKLTLVAAFEGKNMDMVDFLLATVDINIGEGIAAAARSGSLKILKAFVEATNTSVHQVISKSFFIAIENNFEDIINWCLEQIDEDVILKIYEEYLFYEYIMVSAAKAKD